VRIRGLSRRYWVLAGICFIAAMICFMPLRFALAGISPQSELSASAASGTIWSGRIHDVRLGKLSIGTVDVGLRPLELFVTDFSFWFEQDANSRTPPLSGIISKGLGGISIDQFNGAVFITELLPAVPGGTIAFENVTIDMSDDRCRSASGIARLTIDGQIFALIGVNNGLIAQLRCDKGELILPFQGASGMERLTIRMSADGRYRASLLLQQPSEQLTPILAQSGFAAVGSGYSLSGKGRFW